MDLQEVGLGLGGGGMDWKYHA